MYTIGVIIDNQPAKDSKYMGKRSQTTVCKVNEKETSEVETLTHLLKSLTIEVAELKQWTTETTVSSKPPRLAQRKTVTLGSSSGHPTKFA